VVNSLRMSIIENKHKNNYVIYDADFFDNPTDISFEVKTWAARSAIIGFAEGRGTTFFVEYQGRELVLRHYKRGGKIAEYIDDNYFWLGLSFTRAWREFKLLDTMYRCSLPVPRPVAAQVTKEGLFYKADLITQRIRHTQLLLAALKENTLEQGHWVAMGGMVRRFHDKNIHHVDLNVKNILLDEGGRFYLIDFDKCSQRKMTRYWKQASINRLKRSLEKSCRLDSSIVFNEDNWRWFLQGYAS